MKMQLLKFLIFFLFSVNLFSAITEDFIIFLSGKKAYYSENYNDARWYFEQLAKTFPSSKLFKNNYAYFYMGMSYYHLQNYEKAAYYLERAVYLQQKSILTTKNNLEGIYYFSERDFALGDSLFNIGKIDKGKIYLNRVNYKQFYPHASNYEKRALELLSKYSKKAKDTLELKFNYDFSSINKFSFEELIEIGDFYISRRKYNLAKKYYETLLKEREKFLKEQQVLLTDKYLKTLLYLEDYHEIIVFTEKPTSSLFEVCYFYRALAFYRLKNFNKALDYFICLKDGEYKNRAKKYIASLYFTLGNYKKSAYYLKNIKNRAISLETMLGYSYYYLGDKKNYLNSVNSLLERYPTSYAGLYLSFIAENEKKLKIDNSLSGMIYFSEYILKNIKTLPTNFMEKSDILEIEQLSKIATLKDRELLKISFGEDGFLVKNSLQDTYAITSILEKGDFYDLALKNSLSQMRGFIKYKELIKCIYPLYFSEFVNKAAKKYDVPQEMIYAIIHSNSKFNVIYVSENSRYGLMNIVYTNEKLNLEEIFLPESNIDIGTRQLKNYLDKFNGNRIKALIAYNYGEEYLKSLIFKDVNNIDFNSIIIPEERYSLQSMFFTYIFYSKLYNF